MLSDAISKTKTKISTLPSTMAISKLQKAFDPTAESQSKSYQNLNLKQQIELTKKESDLMEDLWKRLKPKLLLYSHDDRYYRKDMLIGIKKTVLLLGFAQAEHFFKKDIKVNITVYLKKNDTESKYSYFV